MKFFLLLVTIPLALASCTAIDEQGSRGGQVATGPKRWEQPVLANAPDTYRFRLYQIGGVVTATSSMGTSVTADNQASWKDTMQAVGAVTTSVYAFKSYAESQITARFLEGQITQRQAAALQQQLALVQTQADVTKFLAVIPK